MNYAKIFAKGPTQWGLRGDPFLWDALGWHLSNQNSEAIPRTEKTAISEIERGLENLTGGLFFSGAEEVNIGWLPKGGMSGGTIHIGTWRTKLIPLILQRIEEAAQKPQGSKDYHPAEHRFRFASICAAMAARSNRSGYTISVEHAVDLLRASQLRFCALGPHWLPFKEKFDQNHSEWCADIVKQARQRYPNFSYGIAAKLVNCFLKAIFIGQFGNGFFDPYGDRKSHGPYDSRIDALHPPVDSPLLQALADSNAGGFQSDWRLLLAKGWSKFEEGDYESAISLIHKITDNCPWSIEFYCAKHA